MAVFFTILQGMEYFNVSYTITDSVFGSCFYMGTGLILGPVIFYIYINKFNLHKIQSFNLLKIISRNISFNKTEVI
jgi:heme/copper-type cytochrome/quinol oxidase subunit 3